MPTSRASAKQLVRFNVPEISCDRDVEVVSTAIRKADPNAAFQIDMSMRKVEIAPLVADLTDYRAAISGAGFKAIRQWPSSVPQQPRSAAQTPVSRPKLQQVPRPQPDALLERTERLHRLEAQNPSEPLVRAGRLVTLVSGAALMPVEGSAPQEGAAPQSGDAPNSLDPRHSRASSLVATKSPGAIQNAPASPGRRSTSTHAFSMISFLKSIFC
jgi:copper chaperone CopZ